MDGEPKGISRRELLGFALGVSALAFTPGAMAASMLQRPIPGTGEPLPAIGLGTWQTFDVPRSEAARAPLRQVLDEFVRLGGKLIDSSPMYGESEAVVGDLAAELRIQKRLFLATKVWTRGAQSGVSQMEESFRRLRVQVMDLMQVHNLVDWRTHLATLRRWKAEGKLRYIGVTHYTASAHDELAAVLESEPVDFVQLNYSVAEREAERRLLPLAADRRVAVLVNRPFAHGELFKKARGKSLPAWAAEIGCATWAQFFLKFVISHPAVTCAIPATSKVEHLRDNMAAGYGPLPDAARRARMARHVESL
ncbi:MAG TPA: aldo/keto reductase [Candidatus Acidoferrales bacterium]|nr:aldo/keto reductase [Candidatus Acidoferrales bacterium]